LRPDRGAGRPPGCWDQRLLKDVKLVQGAGVDFAADGNYELTVALQKSESQKSPKDVPVLSEVGHTVRDARVGMSRRVSGGLDASSNKIYLLHESVARRNVYEPLDVLIRDPHNSLTMKLAVTEEPAKKLLNLDVQDEPFTGEHLFRLLKTAGDHATVPDVDLQQFFTALFSSDQDGTLPVFSLEEREGKPTVYTGKTALFDDFRMSGKLDELQSVMLQYLQGDIGKESGMTLQAFEGDPDDPDTYVTFRTRTISRKMRAESGEAGRWKGFVELELSAEIVEKPNARFTVRAKREEIEERLSARLTALANETLSELRKANCDALGFGKMRTRNLGEWEAKRWKRMYPQGEIAASVKLRVTGQGTLQ
jgi:Ger(x)C family germination protein